MGSVFAYFTNQRLEGASGIENTVGAMIGMWGDRCVGQYRIIKRSSNHGLPHPLLCKLGEFIPFDLHI